MTVREHNIDVIKRLLVVTGFTAKNFLLTARPVRPPALERRRKEIAQLMFRAGISAHDLTSHREMAAAASRPSLALAVGKMEKDYGTRTTEKRR
jgi:hypothetical protein